MFVKIRTFEDMLAENETKGLYDGRMSWMDGAYFTQAMEKVMPEDRVIKVIDGRWKLPNGMNFAITNAMIEEQ